MHDGKNIGKIYSRKRFLLRPAVIINVKAKGKNGEGATNNLQIVDNSKNVNNPKCVGNYNGDRIGRKKKRKIIKIVVIVALIIILFRFFCSYLEPIFQTLCEDKIKSLATIITNQQSTIIMNKYQYDQLYTIEKDENGDIIVVRANVVLINNLISDLTENIQREFDSLHNIKISLPLGSLTGIYFMSGFGPEISINVSVVGTVDTNIKSEFIAQGINQTLHRVYVNFDCEMKIVTPVNNFSQKVTNQVIIAEHVIVGNIPNSYYNLDGFENESDTMQIIK